MPRRSLRALALVASVPLCAAHAARAQSPYDTLRISRDSAVRLARVRNPQLAVAREQIAEFRGARVTAVAVPDPSVTASLDQQPGLFRSAPGGQKNVGVGIAIPFPDKFRLRNSVAVADVRNAQAAYAALDQQIAAQTAQQYDSLRLAYRRRVDLLQAQQLASDFLQRTTARFNAGTVPRLDVIRAQVDAASATNDLIANTRDITAAGAALDRLIARPVGGPILPVDSLQVPYSLPSVEALETIALQSRPELAGIAAERGGARAATTLAREFWLPDLTLGFARNVAPGQPPGVFSTGIAFPLPLFYWQHTRGDISQAQHRERELAASERDLRASISQDVRTAYANALAALKQTEYIRDQLLPSAQAAFRAASASYSIGGTSAFEVIDARRTLLAAETQYTSALAAASSAVTDLQRAVGAPLPTVQAGDTRAP